MTHFPHTGKSAYSPPRRFLVAEGVHQKLADRLASPFQLTYLGGYPLLLNKDSSDINPWMKTRLPSKYPG